MIPALIKREWLRLYRSGGQWMGSLGFLLASVVLVRLQTPSSVILPSAVAEGILWSFIGLTLLLHMGSCLTDDHASGFLDFLRQTPGALEIALFIKVLVTAFWHMTWFVVALPIACALLSIPLNLLISFFFCAPFVSIIGIVFVVVVSSLSLSCGLPALMGSFLLLPLLLPFILLAAGGRDTVGYTALMGAALFLSPLGVLAAGWIYRHTS